MDVIDGSCFVTGSEAHGAECCAWNCDGPIYAVGADRGRASAIVLRGTSVTIDAIAPSRSPGVPQARD
eukprot:2601735-Pyramimonas_sp.AAC.1